MTAYLPILTMICLVVVFIAVSFAASQLLGPRRPNAAKEAPYESGIVPEQEPSERFPVKFYLVAMTFIVLDVEIIFLYPFTTVFRSFSPAVYGLVIMGVFLLTLLVPFAYLLSTGALDWGPAARRLAARVAPGVLRASGKPGASGLDPTAVERDTEAA
jgi:NADH-quinone oxidoreductase subunit A